MHRKSSVYRIDRKVQGIWIKLWLMLLLCCHATPVFAASLAVGATRGYPGVVSTVPVQVRQATNVVALQFDVTYDRNKVADQGLIGETNIPGRIIRSREIAPGVRRTLVYSLTNERIKTNGNLGGVAFRLGERQFAGSGVIAPQNALLATGNGGIIDRVALSGGHIFTAPVSPQDEQGTVRVYFDAALDQDYVLFASTNLILWTSIATNASLQSIVEFIDADAKYHPYRFYSSVLLDSFKESTLRVVQDAGMIRLQAHAPESSVTIEVSEDLTNWRFLTRLNMTNADGQFFEPILGLARTRFYRIQRGAVTRVLPLSPP